MSVGVGLLRLAVLHKRSRTVTFCFETLGAQIHAGYYRVLAGTGANAWIVIMTLLILNIVTKMQQKLFRVRHLGVRRRK